MHSRARSNKTEHMELREREKLSTRKEKQDKKKEIVNNTKARSS